MRPLGALLLALLVGASLAGCSGNADDAEAEPTPPTRVLPSRPGSATPTLVEPNATIRVLELRAAATAEVGLPIQLVARAANDGPDHAPLEVEFALLGLDVAPVLARGPSVEPGVEGDVFANLTPPSIGNFTARASADGSEATLPIAVIGPRIAQLAIELIATEQCSDVIIKTSFRNMGDGRARNARADLSFRQMDGTKVADYATSLGDVQPGQLAESEARVTELRSHCQGEEQRTYDARFTVHADGVLDATLTGVVAVRIV